MRVINYRENVSPGWFEMRAVDEQTGNIAVIIALQTGKVITLEKISVLSEFRRLGIGTTLVSSLDAWSQSTDARIILSPLPVCDADEHSDTQATRRFFQHAGYSTPFGIFLYKRVR